MNQHLLDASSLMLLMKNADPQTQINYLTRSCILDLTFYEIGNAVWKETCLTKFLTKEESTVLRNSIQKVLSKIENLPRQAGDFQKILEISESEKLSFYDASYLYVAQQKGLILVTEDKGLRAKAEKHIEVQNVKKLV